MSAFDQKRTCAFMAATTFGEHYPFARPRQDYVT
jgi:hypothetical protein